jgi:UDP-2,3-diacylglucosamine pyrophosphatase LpxH
MLDAQFLLVLGDNFYPNGVQSVSDPQWRTSLEDVYTAYPLGVDWYVALGNHDYHGNPQAEVEYSSVSRRWRMPNRYYAITKTVAPGVTAEFLIIDTSPFIEAYRKEPEAYHVAGTDTAKQRRWIESTLKASKAQWKFIVGHHNVYSGGKRTVMPDMERLLVPVMKKYGVNAYICGHEHHLEHIQPDGKGPHYFISGAGAEANEAPGTKGTRFSAAGPGFMAMSLFADSMLVQAVNERGKLLYRASIKR